MVNEEHVENVPVTRLAQMVAEERVQPYEIRTCTMVNEEHVENVPVTRLAQMVAEERVQPYEIRTCTMVNEEHVRNRCPSRPASLVAEEHVENVPGDNHPDGLPKQRPGKFRLPSLNRCL